MSVRWQTIFDICARKKVTPTDKRKSAYVPTVDQCRVIESAGIVPSIERPAGEFRVTVLNDVTQSIGASFYHSLRQDPIRAPEPRMGHGFITSWLQVGDVVLLGAIANELFAVKLGATALTEEEIKVNIAARARAATILARALIAKGKPDKRVVVRNDFIRDPYVVQAALNRSGNRCEMPECRTTLFQRDDGRNYVEVHHVIPLSENGDDSLANVAVLCPSCHREHHIGKDRVVKRIRLRAYVDSVS